MQLRRTATLSVSLALALMVAGCGKREINPEKQAQAAEQREARTGMSAERLKLKSVVQQEPKSGLARFNLGALLLTEGDPWAAIIELKNALAYQHPEDEVLPVLAEAMVQAGDTRSLVELHGNTQLQLPEAQARLLAWVALARAAQGDLRGANEAIKAALAADPNSRPAMLSKARLAGMAGDPAAGIAALDTLLAQDAKLDAAWTLKGELQLRQPGGLKAAMQSFEQALQLKPDSTNAISALVAVNLSQGDIETARKHLATLKKVAPTDANTIYVEGHVHYAAADHAKARDSFLVLLKALPENVNVLLSAGENEMKLESNVQAEAYFAKGLSLAPDNTIARRLLARAQLKLGQAPNALVTLAPLVDRPDADADALFLAANARLLNGEARAADALYTRLGQLKPAEAELRTAVAVAAFGKQRDDVVLKELGSIAKEDHGVSADLAIISAQQRKGQFDEALRAASALAAKRPKDPMVPHLQGRLHLLKKDVPSARKSFDQALAINPTYFPSVAALAAMDLQDNQADNARKRLEELLKLEPKNSSARLALAEVKAKLGAPKSEILKELNSAVLASPTDLNVRVALVNQYLKSGETEQALTAAQAAQSVNPDSIELLDLLARSQVAARQTQQALTTYGLIASRYPKLPHAFLGMADAHLANNDLDAAERSINRLLESSPDLVGALGRAAVIAMRKGQPDKALAIARKMQGKPESMQEGLMLEGQVALGQGQLDVATAALSKAVDQFGSSGAAVLLHAAHVRSGKTAAADALTARWLQAHPRDTNFLFNLGTHAEQTKDAAGAEKRYREVLEINPNHPLALNNLAMLLVQQKRSGAVPLALLAVEHAAEKGTFLDTLAQAYAADGQIDKAVEAQQRAVALSPREHGWRLLLAKLLIQAGNKAGAKAEIDRLAALGDEFPQQAEVAELRSSLTLFTSKR